MITKTIDYVLNKIGPKNVMDRLVIKNRWTDRIAKFILLSLIWVIASIPSIFGMLIWWFVSPGLGEYTRVILVMFESVFFGMIQIFFVMLGFGASIVVLTEV